MLLEHVSVYPAGFSHLVAAVGGLVLSVDCGRYVRAQFYTSYPCLGRVQRVFRVLVNCFSYGLCRHR